MSLRQSPRPSVRRFITIKVWLVRLGLMAIVGLCFGLLGFLVSQSWFVGGGAAVLGAAVVARRAFRISPEDIDF